MKRRMDEIIVVFIGLLMLLATVQGALAWSWFGLFPDKSMPDVTYTSQPTTLQDQLNNFFIQHQEFRSLPDDATISLTLTNGPPHNFAEESYFITSRGITKDTEINMYREGVDASIWVSGSFLERLLSTNDVCKFFTDLKLNPEEGRSYGLIKMRNVFMLRWKYGSGNRYCAGSDLWS